MAMHIALRVHPHVLVIVHMAAIDAPQLAMRSGGYVDTFANNTLVFGKGGTYIEVVSCTQHLCPQAPRSELCPSGKCFQHVSGNRIFGDKASVNTPNGTIPVAEWLAMGFDPDSAVVSAAAPTDAELIAMAAATLAESGCVKG